MRIKVAIQTSNKLRGIANINKGRGRTWRLKAVIHIKTKAVSQAITIVSLEENLVSNLEIRKAKPKLQTVQSRPLIGRVSKVRLRELK
ncbi:hypothetical protein KC644_04250 [Candidatus Berkelbacteria bacterium]|nr:hypothetical protein [Candidatus Berkelbacteria bacterium]